MTLSYRGWYKPNKAQRKLALLIPVLIAKRKDSVEDRPQRASALTRSLFQRRMSSNINNETNINDRSNSEASSSESSLIVRIIPGNQLTEASSSDSQSEPSRGERERRCIIEVGVEAPLSSPRRKGVTIRVLQSNLHRVRIYTPLDIEQTHEGVNPNEDLIRVWSPEGCLPWKFNLEITEREREEGANSLKRPASRPGSPQQEAGGPREVSRRLNR